MTTCAQPDGAGLKPSVGELLERGLRRNRAAAPAVEGATCTDSEGYWARFSVEIVDGKVSAVGFRLSSCATLIAYGELIAEIARGLALEAAAGLTARTLIRTLPGVPPLKRIRAVLAVAAFRAALASRADGRGAFR
jgi:hypothetical protein